MKRKDKLFLYNLIVLPQFLGALAYDYEVDDEKAFKETYGLSFKEAENAKEELIKFLLKK